MKITYKDKEYEIKYSLRAMMVYENITEKSFAPKSLTDIIVFFYSSLTAYSDDPIDFNEFLDWLDEDPERLNIFSSWLIELCNNNKLKSPSKEKNIDEEKKQNEEKNIDEEKNKSKN